MDPVKRDAVELSVVMCVHRSHRWLPDAIRSVLEQEDRDFEFLIMANACKEELWDELQVLIAADPRVRLFRTAIGQLAFNLNLAANHARGSYLVRMDADDVCEPHRFGRLRSALAACPVDILGSAVTLIDEQGRMIGTADYPLDHADIMRHMTVRTVICHPAVVIRRQLLLQLRGYLGGLASEDTDLWLRAQRAGARFANLPERLLRYRIHPQQATADRAGYAEVASHWLRELLIQPRWFAAEGLAVALAKWAISPILQRRRRPGGPAHESETQPEGPSA